MSGFQGLEKLPVPVSNVWKSCSMDVAIDIVPMAAGRGGTGSGIWTYTANLLRCLDTCCPANMEIGVFMRRGQRAELGFHFNRLKSVEVVWPNKGIMSRLLWVHVMLPWLCLWKKVRVLHKLATDTPLWCSARRITTLHDFYYEYLMEHTPPERIRWYEKLENVYFQFITRLCFRKSHQLIVVSAAIQQEALHRFPDAGERLVVIHHGAPQGVVSGQLLGAAPLPFSVLTTECMAEDGGRGEKELNAKTQSEAEGRKEALETTNDTKAHKKQRDAAENPQCTMHHSQFNVLYVAKFMVHKGQLEAIRAFERMAELYPALAREVRLRLRGFANDRAYTAELRAAIARSPLAAQIELVTYQSDARVQEIYRDATAALLLSQYEGFGFPVVEAQSQGVPVICSDLPVLREVAGDAALFVNPVQAEEVAKALHGVLTDTVLQEQLRIRGFQNVLRFNWAQTAHQTLDVYRRAMAGV